MQALRFNLHCPALASQHPQRNESLCRLELPTARKGTCKRIKSSAYQRKAPSALHMLLVLVRAHGSHDVLHAAHVSHK